MLWVITVSLNEVVMHTFSSRAVVWFNNTRITSYSQGPMEDLGEWWWHVDLTGHVASE